MKLNLKYFILIIFLTGCNGNTDQAIEEPLSLYRDPVTFPLNTSGGYIINQLTGDSIRSLVNSLGDTIKTGAPIIVKETVIDAPGFKHPQVVNQTPQVKHIIPTNSTLVQGKPKIIPARPEEKFNKLLSVTNRDSVNKNAKGEIVIGKLKPSYGTRIQLKEPKPVKVLPMRYKDDAIDDIQYLDVGQGLKYSYVNALLQDRNGNIWIGTDGYGVCKYDGVYITTYTKKEGLVSDKIRALAEDKNGNIWIGTYEGISVFDGTGFLQFTEKEGLSSNHIASIRSYAGGDLWIGAENVGVTRYNGKGFINYSTNEGLLDNASGAVMQDSRGVYWIATKKGINWFDEKEFSNFNTSENFLKDVFSILEDGKGNIWFASSLNGLIKYDGKVFTRYTVENGLPHNSVLTMIKDREDNIWIGTRYGGVCKFDGTYFTTYKTEQGLSDNKINCMMEDDRGNIWIGTSGGGVNKLNVNGFAEKIKMDYFNKSRVRPIIKDTSGNLWFGTEAAGLYRFDGATMEKYFDRRLFTLHGFRSMFADKKGNLWLGESDGYGIYKYTNRQFRYFQSPRNISINYSIVEDRNGILWFGTSSEGLGRFDGKVLVYYNEEGGLSSNLVLVVFEDKMGNFWFGTENGGLIKYENKFFTVFSEKQGLFAKSVTSIIQDTSGNLWLGTLGAGLCKFDGTNFTYYTEKQGLSFNDIWSLKEDLVGKIWAGTDIGLSVLIPQKDATGKVQTHYNVYAFGLQDGLKATDFNLNSVSIDNNNRIWWGTGKALITRDLNRPFQPQSPRSLKISHIEINGMHMDFRNISDSSKNKISFSSISPFQNNPEKLSLSSKHNHLSFYFSAIEWQAPHKIKYSYRLLGLDNGWSNPSSETYADFRNLPHGRYELQVKAIGESKEWTAPVSYSFTIRPAWWQTWWFKALIIATVLVLIFFIIRFIYYYQLRKQRTAMEKQLAVQYERQRISAEMHDDIGAGLSGIRLLTEMTKNKVKDDQAAEEVEKIYQSVGDISSKMKEVIWSLNTENDSLPNLITYIQKQARLWLENYPCQLTVELPETIPAVEINGETRRNILLIVKEAIHNIIKHSGANKVSIKMNSNNEQLIITIADNGKGIAAEKSDSTGNGMKNMRQRVQQLNGKFFINNQEGVILIVEIPLKAAI